MIDSWTAQQPQPQLRQRGGSEKEAEATVDPGGRVVVIMEAAPFMRAALASFIEGELELGPVAAYETAQDAAEAEAAHQEPAQLVLLYRGGCDDDEATLHSCVAQAQAALASATVALIADSEDPQLIARLMRSGVRAYVPRSTSASLFRLALLLVAAGGVYVPETAAGAQAAGALLRTPEDEGEANPSLELLADFTPRELDVLRHLSAGLQNKLIAHELGLQESTVKVHLRHIMRKLHVTCRTQAALLAHDVINHGKAPESDLT